MKILIVANTNRGTYAPFVVAQAEALEREGVEVVWFGVVGHGVAGYLRNIPLLRKTIAKEKPDIVHAHYGLCGVVACMQLRSATLWSQRLHKCLWSQRLHKCLWSQRQVPVVTTYHGSDINQKKARLLCRPALRRSAVNIFVSQHLKELAGKCRNAIVQPCGIDLEQFPETPKPQARARMGLDVEGKYVLFCSAFDNPVKNAPLAQEALRQLPEATLVELKGYSRDEVALMMRAVDCLLMTSHSEGSPQVIKEALACGTPIVSVDVGDVAWLTEGVEGCWLAERNPDDIAWKLRQAINFSQPTAGRRRIESLGIVNHTIALKLKEIYEDTYRT